MSLGFFCFGKKGGSQKMGEGGKIENYGQFRKLFPAELKDVICKAMFDTAAELNSLPFAYTKTENDEECNYTFGKLKKYPSVTIQELFDSIDKEYVKAKQVAETAPDYKDWAVIKNPEAYCLAYRLYRQLSEEDMSEEILDSLDDDFNQAKAYYGSPFLMKWDGEKFLYAKMPKPSGSERAAHIKAEGEKMEKEVNAFCDKWHREAVDFFNKHFAQREG